MDFWRGRYTWSRLASLIEILQARGDSYLTWARSRDVEVYRAARDAGALSSATRKPESFEMNQTAQILASLFYLIQQEIHVTTRTKKKFNGKRWPHPETAADIVKREDADRGYESLMQDIVFLPPDEFEAHIAAHQGEHPEVRRGPGVETSTDPTEALHDSDRAWLDAHSPGWDQTTS